jgi:putative ABC transport system ATP-binding protein
MDQTTQNLYELTGVHKHFGSGPAMVRALDGVDLTIAESEFLAIQGPTGQGKSTLLMLLGGLDRATSGRLAFEGRDLGTLGEDALADLRAGAFGFVFQTFNLIPTLTAQENVETALVPTHLESVERRRRASHVLEELGLGDRLTHLPHELSGGQQQRVAIARALVKNPRVLLADEPTGNLDEQTRDEIVGLLEDLWRERGLTLIVVTHDSSIARRAQRIAVIRGGRVSLSGVDVLSVG